MEITGADARRVLGLTRELEDATRAEELWERALTAVMTLVPADAGQRYRLSANGDGVSAFSLPEESFHADPMVIYDHPLDHRQRGARRTDRSSPPGASGCRTGKAVSP